MWDQARFRGDSSKVVQSLSSTDFLAHVYVRGTDLVLVADSGDGSGLKQGYPPHLLVSTA